MSIRLPGQTSNEAAKPPAPAEGTARVSDEQAIEAICRRQRQAVAHNDFSDAGQWVWIGPYVLFVPMTGAPNTLVGTWEEGLQGWRDGLDALEEIIPCTERPEYQIDGPVALGRWKAVEARVDGKLQKFGGLIVLARRRGDWRIAAEIIGDWKLSEQDRFDPANADHQKLDQLCEGEVRIYREKNADLLDDLYLPRCRAIFADAANPQTALVLDNDQVRDAVEYLLKDDAFHKPRATISHVKIEGPMAVALREEEGRPVCMTLFALTPEGWRIGLNVEGDWRAFFFRTADTVEDWCEQVRDTWRQRDFSRLTQLVWADEFVLVFPDHQSGYGGLMPWIEDEMHSERMQESMDEIEVPDEKPVYRVDGPLALVRWVSARYRTGDEWHESEGIEFLARRDGRWGGVAWLPGDWRLAATDVYDDTNADHVAIQALLDEADRAFVAKEWDALRDTKHPSYRFLYHKADRPEDAVTSDLDQSLQIVRRWMEDAPVRERRATIDLVKVDGPLAITTGTSTQVAEDGTTTEAPVFNVYCRKPEGWRVALTVAGAWDPVFLEGRTSAETGRARMRPKKRTLGGRGSRGGRQPGRNLP